MPFLRYLGPGLLLLVLPSAAFTQELKIVEVQWGFDGQVVPNEFNPLSVLLDNQGDEPFEGDIVLTQRRGTGQPVGADFRSVAYLPPLQRSWVRFVPYISSADPGDWTLSWRAAEVSEATGRLSRGTDRLRKAQMGQAAVVYFKDPSGLGSGAKGIRHYDETLFPASVTGTHGLRSAVLDHEPRWLSPQRQAFADWVQLGGQVHLLKSEDGGYPTFSEELSILNGPVSPTGRRIGSGAIFHHDLQASGLKSGTAFPKVARGVELRFRGEPSNPDRLNESIQKLRAQASQGYYSSIQLGWDAAERAHSSLIEITQPEHNWPLIFVLAIAYILMIFPGCYIIGRRRFHYLITYGSILGAAALFSVAFLIIGRRGYGERTEINSVAIVQKIEGDRWDVMQWSNVFVTSGGEYTLQHGGDGAVYSAGQEMEKVNGQIALADREDDNIGRSFVVDIPPFSNRPYVHRQVVSMAGYGARLKEFAAGDRVSKVRIEIDEKLKSLLAGRVSLELPSLGYGDGPAWRELPVLRLVYRDQVYSLKHNGGDHLSLSASLGELDSAVSVSSLTTPYSAFSYLYDDNKPSPQVRYARMFDAMLAHRFGIFKDVDFANAMLRQDVARLLIYAPMPEEMNVANEAFANQRGYVLFSQDLRVDEINE